MKAETNTGAVAALPRANIIEIVHVNVKTKGVKAHGIDTRQQAIAIGMGKMSLPMYSESPAPRHVPANIKGKSWPPIKPKPKLIPKANIFIKEMEIKSPTVSKLLSSSFV